MRIQIKVPLLVIGILFIIGTIAGGLILYFNGRASVNQFEQMAVALSGVVRGSLEQNMLSGERQQTEQAMLRIRKEEMVKAVVLFSPDSTIAASTDPSSVGKMADDASLNFVLQSGTNSMQSQRQDGHSELLMTTPVFNSPECESCHPPQNKVLGAIKVTLDASPLDNETKQETTFIIILGVVTFVIVGTGVAMVLRSTVLNPLSRLSESASRFSQGDYATRADESTTYEIGLLAKTFNNMASSVEQRSRELEASQQELTRWNTDLEDKVTQRTQELSALNAVITEVSRSLDLDTMLGNALPKIVAVTSMESGAIHLWDEKANRLVLLAQLGLSQSDVQKMEKVVPGDGLVGGVFAVGQPVITNDINNTTYAQVDVAQAQGWQSYAGFPVKSKNNVVGVLSLMSAFPNRFEVEKQRLVSAMAEAIGIAADNAIAAQRLKEANRLKQELLEKLISAQEEERRRIARELHDEASQSLAALSLRLQEIGETLPSRYRNIREKLDVLNEQAIHTLGGIRDLALELRPSSLDDLGLAMAIQWYAKDYLGKRGLEATVAVINPGGRKLPSYTETMLFRIVQEALTNIVKHAGATQVKIRLEIDDVKAVALVEDNGKGFDVDSALGKEAVRQHLGLHGMAERAGLLGGTLTIKSKLGQGTCVRVEVPAPQKEMKSE